MTYPRLICQVICDALHYYGGVLKRKTRIGDGPARERVYGCVLFRRVDCGYELVERNPRRPYAVSPDGRWFTHGSVSDGANRWLPGWRDGVPVLHIVSLDGQTTLSIRGGERMRLTARWPEYRFRNLGASAGSKMVPWVFSHLSAEPCLVGDGRFVLFERIHSIHAPNKAGEVGDTGIPETLEVGVLDLRTARETVVLHLRPESVWLCDHYGRSLDHWRNGNPAVGGLQPRPLKDSSDFVHLRHAPGRPRWAVYYDGWLTVFDAVAHDALGEDMTFREVQRIDLRGILSPTHYADKNFIFVDDWTILVWDSRFGIFRIDLPGRGT